MSVLVCSDVHKEFGGAARSRIGVERCSFKAAAGEIIGVVGASGAGKTTLLRLIAGEIPLTSGRIEVRGLCAGTRAARRIVGSAPSPFLAPVELSGVEWLKYLASHRAATPGERTALVRWAVELADLDDLAGRSIGEYPRGSAQRLAVAAAGLMGSAVVVLDEVLHGLDPLIARRLRGQIGKLAEAGRAVLVASHDLSSLERLATRVLVLWRGRLSADVSTAKLMTERVAEISLQGSGRAHCERLLLRFRGAVRTGDGVAVPLAAGLSIEEIVAVCRAERIAVSATRVRFRALEDILVAAEARAGHDP